MVRACKITSFGPLKLLACFNPLYIEYIIEKQILALTIFWQKNAYIIRGPNYGPETFG